MRHGVLLLSVVYQYHIHVKLRQHLIFLCQINNVPYGVNLEGKAFDLFVPNFSYWSSNLSDSHLSSHVLVVRQENKHSFLESLRTSVTIGKVELKGLVPKAISVDHKHLHAFACTHWVLFCIHLEWQDFISFIHWFHLNRTRVTLNRRSTSLQYEGGSLASLPQDNARNMKILDQTHCAVCFLSCWCICSHVTLPSFLPCLLSLSKGTLLTQPFCNEFNL